MILKDEGRRMKDELPPSWKTASIDEVSDVNPRSFCPIPSAADLPVHFVPMSSVIEEFGGIDISTIRALREVQKGYTPFLENDVLFAKITPCMENGKMALVPSLPEHIAFGSTEFHVLRSTEAITAKWLAYFLSQSEFRRFARQNMTGSAGQLRVSTNWLSSAQIPVAPLVEQTRIVEKLEELLSDLDAGVAELKAAQKKLGQYRQALLKAAVEGALTAEWRAKRHESDHGSTSSPRTDSPCISVHPELVEGRAASPIHPSTSSGRTGKTAQTEETETGAQLLARILAERRQRWEEKQLAKFKEQGKTPPKGWQDKYSEPVKPETTNLPTLPQGWVWANLGLCFYVGVGATPSRKEPSYWKGDIPWVSSGEIQFSRISSTREHISEKGLKNSSTQINPKGSVLLGMIGEGKTRGQVSILDIDAANNQNCAAIWVPETQIKSEFVYFWLWSQYEETRRGSSGNNQPALNKSLAEKIPMPLPPLDEIEVIADMLISALDNISKQESAVQYSLKQSAAQRKNILKSAFSGQLVPQDPTDEPASVLLERIRAERAARDANGKHGRNKIKDNDNSSVKNKTGGKQ